MVVFMNKRAICLMVSVLLVFTSSSLVLAEIQNKEALKQAKPAFLIEDRLEDREWLTELVRITAAALPFPKPKKKK